MVPLCADVWLCRLQVPVQYQQDLLDNLDAAAADVEEVDSSGSTSTVIAQVGLHQDRQRCRGVLGNPNCV